MGIFVIVGFFKEVYDIVGNIIEIVLVVGGNNIEKILVGFFGKVGFFEDILGGVDVGKIECGFGMV